MSRYAPLTQIQIAYWLIALQVAVTIVMALGGLLHSKPAAGSALAGGGFAVGGTALLALFTFKHKGARQAKKILLGFYLGEWGRLVLTAAGFWLLFKFWPGVQGGWLIGAFAVTHFIPYVVWGLQKQL